MSTARDRSTRVDTERDRRRTGDCAGRSVAESPRSAQPGARVKVSATDHRTRAHATPGTERRSHTPKRRLDVRQVRA